MLSGKITSRRQYQDVTPSILIPDHFVCNVRLSNLLSNLLTQLAGIGSYGAIKENLEIKPTRLIHNCIKN